MNVSRRRARVVLGPGQLMTGTHRHACDGAVVALTWERVGRTDERPVEARIEQLHDLNVGRHRTVVETREHLRRCLRLLLREGLVVHVDGETWLIPADRVSATSQLKLHVFHRSDRASGPFADP